MKNLAFGMLLAAGVMFAASAYANLEMKPEGFTRNASRACIPAAGAAQEITATTATSDASSQLNAPAVYMLRCDTDAYVRWGSSAPTAAAGDFKLGAETILYFATDGDHNFMAAKSISVNGSCWVLECM